MGPRFCKRGNMLTVGAMALPLLGASMGPRFCKRGNRREQVAIRRGVDRLQWGHAFVSVETRMSRATLLSRPASMGPRFCKRGNWWTRLRRHSGSHVASMGPRFCKRGNSCGACARAISNSQASMGPRFCKRGNYAVHYTTLTRACASMGPRFCKRGNVRNKARYAAFVVGLQWGHAFVSVETRG